MKLTWLSFKDDESWIEIQTEGIWKKTVNITYNEKLVVTKKIGFVFRRRIFEFDIVKEDTNTHYLVEMIPVQQGIMKINVFRDGEAIVAVGGGRRQALLPVAPEIDTTIRAYEVMDSGKTIEIPRGAVNMDSSSVYCFVSPRRMTIYLWRGENATFRIKRIGEGAAAKLRREIGFDYRLELIDEGGEPNEFRGGFE